MSERVRDQRADTFSAFGLPVDQLAEQDIVLQRARGIVAFGIKKLDGTLQVFRQFLGEDRAGLQNFCLQGLVHNTQTMLRSHNLERQR